MLILALAITTAPHPSDSREESDEDASYEEGRPSSMSRPVNSGFSQSKSQQKLRAEVRDDEDSDFDL